MSQIKLKHSGGNGVIIAAPSSNPASDRTITLPSDADGTLARTSDVAFKSVAIIADVKTKATDGGTFTAGSFQQRDLNTVLYDPDSIVSLSSNDFTLQAGSYFVRASAPAFHVDSHMCLLRNHTDSTNIQTGSSEFSSDPNDGYNRSFVSARFTITAAKALRITHKCQTTKSSNGFGISTNMASEMYTIVEIFKEP